MNDLRAERLQVMLSPEEARLRQLMISGSGIACRRALRRFASSSSSGSRPQAIETSIELCSGGVKSSEFGVFGRGPKAMRRRSPKATPRIDFRQPHRKNRPSTSGCQGRPWRLLPEHRGHVTGKQSVELLARGNCSWRRFSRWRHPGIIRRHCRSLASCCYRLVRIARRFLRRRALLICVVRGLRPHFIARLIFRALVLYDAVVGMCDDVLSPCPMPRGA